MASSVQPQVLRILYVEDNPLVRETTEELLQKPGREIHVCGTAEEALQLLQSQHFALVITDVSLPVMSGIDLTRRILAAYAHTAIIIVSGYHMEAVMDALGPRVRAIVKPITAGEIDLIIDELS